MSRKRRDQIVLVVLCVVGACACVALLQGLMALERQGIANDREYRERRDAAPDAVACRAAHGFPVYSKWDGQMIDCKPLPRIAEAPDAAR